MNPPSGEASLGRGLLARVRAACALVAERARRVRIDERRIPPYGEELVELARGAPPPGPDPETHLLDRDRETLVFFLLLDAVNFGSGYFPHLQKRPGRSGYFTVAGALADHLRAHGVPTPDSLTALEAEDCFGLFGQDRSSEPIAELMERFARAWSDLGEWLLERFDGRWEGPVQAAAGSAERLVALLAEMPYFRDVSRYEGLEVPFYKRAQITPADLHHAFRGEGWGRFHDLDRLTIFADNLVPHVLRVDGVLRYAEPLAARVDSEEPIAAGSPEEVEIRACALHAVELLVAVIRERGHDVNAMRLDYLLWNRGQGTRYKSRPRHRTRTVYY